MSRYDKTPQFEAFATSGSEQGSIKVLFFEGSTDLFERDGLTDIRHYKTTRGNVKFITYHVVLSEDKVREIIDKWVAGDVEIIPLNPEAKEPTQKPRKATREKGR